MANDATNKLTSNSELTENSSLSNAGDQQKVPPLRIVLNSTSNQKSSTTVAPANHQTSTSTNNKKDKSQDARQEGTLKVGGRVRIKLGTNKHQPVGSRANNNHETNESSNAKTDNHRAKEKATGDKQEENINEDSTSSFTHLRRITRRSQRTVQSISNEDEESISSMTSVDENITANNNQANSDSTQDPDQSNPAPTNSSSATNNAANGSANNQDTPRRYKRRKVETSESQSLECDNLLGIQNYKLPNQNSFELFKNIRKQVDKNLKSLTSIQPKTPHGLRDYLLARGTYLLDGNKLGNGTNLFMNEDGGLNPAPLGKYHLIRQNRVNYSVPNRTKVPLGLPVNSPLYDLFIEQERERYRMRIQHIKEREKLTLATEQEFIRVYSQAALAAANQKEPFSVCTLLKHQEIYNYMDSDGTTILSREDAQQDQVNQQNGVRTRRRQHGQISPGPARKGSTADEPSDAPENSKKDSNEASGPKGDDKKTDTNSPNSAESADKDTTDKDSETAKTGTDFFTSGKVMEKTDSQLDQKESGETRSEKPDPSKQKTSDTEEKIIIKTECADDEKPLDKTDNEHIESKSEQSTTEQSKNPTCEDLDKDSNETPTQADQSDPSADGKSSDGATSTTDEEKNTLNKEAFLVHLQETDDKWDKIRQEMLIRHRNEAESLHAIQRLEWEWKTKEIGACDVRTTLIIDNTLVPKLDIFSQDY